MVALAILPFGMAEGLAAALQDEIVQVQTNSVMEAGNLEDTNEVLQADDSMPNEEGTAPEGLNQTNGLAGAQTNGAPRPSRRSRSRRGRRDPNGAFGSGADSLGDSYGAQTNNGPARPAYSTFEIVANRNIFDPNRHPGQIFRPHPDAPRLGDSFTFVGTMSYDKGTFAFFDGTRSEYQKALKPAEAIADYKVTSITPDSVKLTSGTNQLELRVGMQMRREPQGEWLLSATTSQNYAASPAATPAGGPGAEGGATSVETAIGGPESEVLKRLMQRRERE